MDMLKMRENESGMALITSLIIMMAIAIISGALMFETTTQYRIGRRSKAEAVAVNLAEAGIEYAIWSLNNDDNFTAAGPVSVGEGTYSCSVTTVGVTGRLIEATGSAAGYPAQRTIMVRVEMAPALGAEGEGPEMFGYAAFGTDKVENMTFTGNAWTDGYSSDSGGYAASVGDTGDIRSNANITLGPNVTINGDATPGPGCEVTGQGSVTGSTDPAETYATLPDIPNTETAKCTQSLSISGNSTVEIGVVGETTTYYFTSISISGNGRLKIVEGANVIFYVSGNMSLGGNGVENKNIDQDATTLQIYCAGAKASITGNGKFAAAVYAPNATLSIVGNGAAYGSFIGKKISATGNGNIHYDMATAKIVPSWYQQAVEEGYQGVHMIVSWQRM